MPVPNPVPPLLTVETSQSRSRGREYRTRRERRKSCIVATPDVATLIGIPAVSGVVPAHLVVGKGVDGECGHGTHDGDPVRCRRFYWPEQFANRRISERLGKSTDEGLLLNHAAALIAYRSQSADLDRWEDE